MFEGTYHGKTRHPSDLEAIVQRAKDAGVERILITGTSLSESRGALNLAKRFGELIKPILKPTKGLI
jgi:TatD DNase family protein